jgi:hypothetical protein
MAYKGVFRRKSYGVPGLRILPGGPSASYVGAGLLSGAYGETCTFTRASNKSVLLPTNGLATLSTNIPGVEARGLLMEDAATNAIRNAESNVGGTGWTVRGTATANVAGVPGVDGTANKASRLSVNTAGNDVFAQTAGVGVSLGLATQFWLKRVSTSGTLRVQNPFGPSFGDWAIDLAALGADWNYIVPGHAALTVATPFVSHTSGGAGVYFYASAGGPLSFDICRVQQEVGSFPTSFIPTPSGASATRNKDRAIFPAVAPVAAGSVELDFVPQWSTSTIPSQCYLINTCSAAARSGIIAFVNSGTAALFFQTLDAAGGFGQATVAAGPGRTWVAGQSYRLMFKWGNGNLWIYRDGSLLGSSLTGSAVMPDGANTINLGTAYNGNNPCYGWISNVIFREGV